MRVVFAGAAIVAGWSPVWADDCVKAENGSYICNSVARLPSPQSGNEQRPGGEAKSVMEKRLDQVRQNTESAPVSVPAALAPDTAPAVGPESAPSLAGKAEKAARHPSVYGGYGQKVFLRGGYGFSDYGDGLEKGAVFSAGYSRKVNKAGSGAMSVEAEVIAAIGEDEATPGVDVETRHVALLASLRYDGAPGGAVNPFLSLGVGPAHQAIEVETGALSSKDSKIVLGYTARAGLETTMLEALSLEAAYRYLGFYDDDASAVHAAEIGVNYAF